MQSNQNYCFCTLALGRNYSFLAKQLADDLAMYSPESKLLVLTDNSNVFETVKNAIVIEHDKRSVLGYNDKLCVIDRALRLYDTCIFLDADDRILGPINLDENIFQPGLRVFRLRTWEYNRQEALSGKPATWKKDGIRIMKLLRKKYDIPKQDRNVPFVCEFLFSITRDDNTRFFLQKWNELAIFCEMNRFFVHEGYSIGLGALLSGFPIFQDNFKGIHFFDHLISLQHMQDGSMTLSEYNCLYSEMLLHKPKTSTMLEKIKRKILAMINVEFRYLKIRLYGINLLS
jgi:hypothetical protein